MVGKNFRFLILIGELCRGGREGQKLDLLCILNLFSVVLINLQCQLNFLFLLKGKDLFCMVVILLSFVGYYFFFNVNMEMIQMYLINQLHSNYFDNLNKVGNVVDCLFYRTYRLYYVSFYCIFTF